MSYSLIDVFARGMFADTLNAVVSLLASLVVACAVVWAGGRAWNRKWAENTREFPFLIFALTVCLFITWGVFGQAPRLLAELRGDPSEMVSPMNLVWHHFESAHRQAKARCGASQEPPALAQAKILAGETMAPADAFGKALPFRDEDFTGQGERWLRLKNFLSLPPARRDKIEDSQDGFYQNAADVCWRARRTCERRVCLRGLEKVSDAAGIWLLAELLVALGVCGWCAYADIELIEPVVQGKKKFK